jgi:hypothetical protein
MGTRRLFDIIADVLILLALTVAGVGHFLHWFRAFSPFGRPILSRELVDFQAWHAIRSGAALVVLAALVFVSLTVPIGARVRKVLVLLMFFATLTAIIFQALVFSPYGAGRWWEDLPELRADGGYFAALVPTIFAGVFCLIRMIWTMGATDKPPLVSPAFEKPIVAEPFVPEGSPPRTDDATRYRR